MIYKRSADLFSYKIYFHGNALAFDITQKIGFHAKLIRTSKMRRHENSFNTIYNILLYSEARASELQRTAASMLSRVNATLF